MCVFGLFSFFFFSLCVTLEGKSTLHQVQTLLQLSRRKEQFKDVLAATKAREEMAAKTTKKAIKTQTTLKMKSQTKEINNRVTKQNKYTIICTQ